MAFLQNVENSNRIVFYVFYKFVDVCVDMTIKKGKQTGVVAFTGFRNHRLLLVFIRYQQQVPSKGRS